MRKNKFLILAAAFALTISGCANVNNVRQSPFKAGNNTVTGTINFGSAQGSTSVNSTSVTGDDSEGNTWTITTVMEKTSFTQSSNYSQIGASSKPATSINFTTTLADEQTFTAFSAKFGGFSGTNGSISLKIDDEVVGSGSLNATTDVIVNSSSATGSTLTIDVTNIAKGVKVYYISYSYENNGGSGEDPELTPMDAPSISLSGTTVSWTNIDGNNGYSYSITGDGTKDGDLDADTTSLDVSTLGLAYGSYSITVTTKGDGTATSDSAPSNAQAFTLTEPVVSGTFNLLSGTLIEGDYVIYYNGYALKKYYIVK